jgi:hypothetical protein
MDTQATLQSMSITGTNFKNLKSANYHERLQSAAKMGHYQIYEKQVPYIVQTKLMSGQKSNLSRNHDVAQLIEEHRDSKLISRASTPEPKLTIHIQQKNKL